MRCRMNSWVFFNDRPSDSPVGAQEDDAVSNAYSARTLAQDPVFEETPVDAAEGEALDEDLQKPRW